MRRLVLSAAAGVACMALLIGLNCGGSEVVGRGGSEVVGVTVTSTGVPINNAAVIAYKQIDTVLTRLPQRQAAPMESSPL
jgi:hypothetical protein